MRPSPVIATILAWSGLALANGVPLRIKLGTLRLSKVAKPVSLEPGTCLILAGHYVNHADDGLVAIGRTNEEGFGEAALAADPGTHIVIARHDGIEIDGRMRKIDGWNV